MPTDLVFRATPRADHPSSRMLISLVIVLYALVLITHCRCGAIAPELMMVASP